MTLDEFLERLRETPRDWRLDGGVILRAENQCPFMAVPGAGRLKSWLCDAVWAAADSAPGHDPALRAQILDACGLKED